MTHATTIRAQRNFLSDKPKRRPIPWFSIFASGMWGAFGIMSLALAIEFFMVGGFWGIMLGIAYLCGAALLGGLAINVWTMGW